MHSNKLTTAVESKFNVGAEAPTYPPVKPSDLPEKRTEPVSSAPVTNGLTHEPGSTGVHHMGARLPGSNTVPDVPDRPRGVDATGQKVPLMDRAKGYAKVQAGTFFGNEKEVAMGEAALRGENVGQRP